MRSLASILSAALLLTCPGAEAYAQVARVKVGNVAAHADGGFAGGIPRVGGHLDGQGLSMRLSSLNGGSLKLLPSLDTLPSASVLPTARGLDASELSSENGAESLDDQAELAKQLGLRKTDIVKALEENGVAGSVPKTSRFAGAAKKIGSGIKSLRQIFSFRGESPDIVGPQFHFTDGLKGGKNASKTASSGLSKTEQTSNDATSDDKKDIEVPPVVPPSDNGGSNRDPNGGKGGKSWLGMGKVAVMLILSLIFMQIGVEAWGAALGPLIQQVYGDFTILATVGIWASIGAIIGRLNAPLAVTRFGIKKTYIGANILRLVSVSILCGLLATGHMTLPLMIFFYAVNGLVGGVATTSLDTLASTLMDGDGVKLEKFWTWENTLLETIGVTAPILTGAVVVAFGFMPALIAYPIAFAIAIIVVALAMRKKLAAMGQADAKLQAQDAKRAPRASLWSGVAKLFWPIYAPVARFAIRWSRVLAPIGAALALIAGFAGVFAAATPGVVAATNGGMMLAGVLVLAAGVYAAFKLVVLALRATRPARERWLAELAASAPKPGLLARMSAGVKSTWKDKTTRWSPMAWLKAVILEPLAGTVVGRFFSKMARGAKYVWSDRARRSEPANWSKYVVAYPFSGTMLGGFFQNIARGARIVWKNPVLRYSFLAFTAFMITNPLLYGMLAPGYGNLLAGAGNEALMTAIAGWLTGFYSLGGLLVGFLMIREQKIIKKGKPEGATLEAAPQENVPFAKTASRLGRSAKGGLWVLAASLPVLVKTFGIPAVILVSGFLGYIVAIAYSPWAALFILVGLSTAGTKAILAAAGWLDRRLTPRAKAYFVERFKQEAPATPSQKRTFKERLAGLKASVKAFRRDAVDVLWKITPKSWFKARRQAYLEKRAAEDALNPVKFVEYTKEEQAEMLRRSMLRWMKWGTLGLAAIATLAVPLPLIGSSLSIPALLLIPFGIAQVAAQIKLTSFFQANVPKVEADKVAVLGFFRAASLAASTIGLLSLKYLFNATTGYAPFVVVALALIPLAAYYLYLTNKLRKVTDPSKPDSSDHPAVKKIAGFVAGAFMAGMVGLTAAGGGWLMTLVAVAVLALSARGRWAGEKTLLAEQSRKGWDGWMTISKDSRLMHFALGVLSVALFGLLS